jgi:hypothetical protein
VKFENGIIIDYQQKLTGIHDSRQNFIRVGSSDLNGKGGPS